MEWETLYCPNKRCRYFGLPFQQGNMVKNGSSYLNLGQNGGNELAKIEGDEPHYG